MSEYYAKVNWTRANDEKYIDNKYFRVNEQSFDGGVIVKTSSSPHIVPLPYSVEANEDPREAFITSLSSCHMLFFLGIAAKEHYVVDSYLDNTVGLMEKLRGVIQK